MPHIHDKIDFCSEVFVVNENAVLLRLHDKYNMWLSVGGHIELDEDPVRAAIREVKEEVGLDVTIFDTRATIVPSDERAGYTELIPPRFMNRHAISETHDHVALIYFATSTTRDIVPEKETDKWQWVTRDELNSIEGLKPTIKMYAETALRELKTNA